MSVTHTIYWGHCSKCGAVIYGSAERPSDDEQADISSVQLHRRWHEEIEQNIYSAQITAERAEIPNRLLA